MPASIATDDSFDGELALHHDEIRELETFEDSAQADSVQDTTSLLMKIGPPLVPRYPLCSRSGIQM